VSHAQAFRIPRPRQSVQIDAQKALLTYLPLDVKNLETFRAGYALSRLANRHKIHSILSTAFIWRGHPTRPYVAPNKKVGSRPLDHATILEATHYNFVTPETQPSTDHAPAPKNRIFP
jgi:hypothetical protein